MAPVMRAIAQDFFCNFDVFCLIVLHVFVGFHAFGLTLGQNKIKPMKGCIFISSQNICLGSRAGVIGGPVEVSP